MGILRLALGEGTTNMKLFVFACLLPWLWPTPSPRLMPIPTTATTAWATMVLDTGATDTVLDTTDTPVLAITDTVLATTARGLLMLSQLPLLRPRLMPIPTTDTTAMDTDLDMPVTDTVSDTTDTPVLATTDTVLDTTARGPLSPLPSPPLPPPLRLIPTTDTTAMDTDTVLDMPVTDTVLATTDTAVVCTDTTDKCPADSSHRKTSLGITSSSSEKMDRSVWFDPHQCYQFQCHQASPS